MDASLDVPEVTERCWSIPGQVARRGDVRRLVVHRRGDASPRVVACTLLPYDPGFDLGVTLADAWRPVMLNHPHCARFCVLGGASCSR